MAVSHEYMLQAHKALQDAKVVLGKAQNAVSQATATNTMLGSSGDSSSVYWGTAGSSGAWGSSGTSGDAGGLLGGYIALAIQAVNTALANVYYSPEQEHG